MTLPMSLFFCLISGVLTVVVLLLKGIKSSSYQPSATSSLTTTPHPKSKVGGGHELEIFTLSNPGYKQCVEETLAAFLQAHDDSLQ